MNLRLTRLACLVLTVAACGAGRIQPMSTAAPDGGQTAPAADGGPQPDQPEVGPEKVQPPPGPEVNGPSTGGAQPPLATPPPATDPGPTNLPPPPTDPSTTGNDPLPATQYCQSFTQWDAGWVAMEDEVLQLVNQARAQGATCAGVPFQPAGPLVNHASLRCSARAHATDMGMNNYLAHNNHQGQTPGDRIKAADYSPRTWGENIAYGQQTAAKVVQGFMSDYGHCANIMNPAFRTMGNGYYLNSNGRPYWVEDFGG